MISSDKNAFFFLQFHSINLRCLRVNVCKDDQGKINRADRADSQNGVDGADKVDRANKGRADVEKPNGVDKGKADIEKPDGVDKGGAEVKKLNGSGIGVEDPGLGDPWTEKKRVTR